MLERVSGEVKRLPAAVAFAKLGKVRFIQPPRPRPDVGARRSASSISRSPITEGFTPRPKISFGLALSIGRRIGSRVRRHRPAARSDADRDRRVADTLSAALPDGLRRRSCVAERAERAPVAPRGRHVVHVGARVLSSASSHHRRRLPRRLLESASLELDRERKGKRSVDDVRPMILDMRARSDHRGDRLVAELATNGTRSDRTSSPSWPTRTSTPSTSGSSVLTNGLNTTANGARCSLHEPAIDAVVDASPIEVLMHEKGPQLDDISQRRRLTGDRTRRRSGARQR